MSQHALLRFSPDFIVQLCKSDSLMCARVTGNALPADAHAVGMVRMGADQAIVVESAAFADVSDDEVLPELPQVQFTTDAWAAALKREHLNLASLVRGYLLALRSIEHAQRANNPNEVERMRASAREHLDALMQAVAT